jgi:hypothetical protein
MNTQTTYTDKSILTNLSLFCKSDLQQTVLQFFSSSVCLAGLLCINFFCHSALLLSSASALLLCISSHSAHLLNFMLCHLLFSFFLLFHSFFLFRTTNLHTICLIFFYTHFLDDGSTSPSFRKQEHLS